MRRSLSSPGWATLVNAGQFILLSHYAFSPAVSSTYAPGTLCDADIRWTYGIFFTIFGGCLLSPILVPWSL